IETWASVAIVHISTSNPFCVGSHSDLISSFIISEHRSECVCAVSSVIAGNRLRIAATIHAVFVRSFEDRIVPVVVVVDSSVCRDATVLAFKSGMVPLDSRVLRSYDYSGASNIQFPNLRNIDGGEARFDCSP